MSRTFIRASLVPMLFTFLLVTPCPVSLAVELKPGEGLVIFTREDKFAGKAIRFNINVDGSPKLQLLAGSTIELPLPSGTHTFSVYTPSLDGQDTITIEITDGWTYHIEGYTLVGWPTGRPKFRLISEVGPPPGTAATGSSSAAQGQISSEVLASAALGAATARPATNAQPGRTAEESGRIGLRNFIGNWHLEMWSLAADGTKLMGHGVAEGSTESESAVRIYITEFDAPAFPTATGGGQVRIAYDLESGFTLESLFEHSQETLKFAGRYEADTGRYVFYLFGSTGETATGIARRSTRVEIRSIDLGTWVADTYSSVDGQSVKVQSYRFGRRE